MRRPLLFLLPGGVLLLAATVVPHLGGLRESLPRLAPVYFYVVFGGGILLACRFDRSRLVLALLVLALADRALLHLGRPVASAVALLLPLNLAALSVLSERGLLTRRGRVKLLILALEALVVSLVSHPEFASPPAWLDYAFVEAPPWLSALGLSQPALAAFALAFGLMAVRFVHHPTALESGPLWALVAAFAALASGPGALVSTFYLTTAGLILVVSLVETSHGMAYGDELTRLPGRRALTEALLKLGDRYAIAMVDIDHFKRFNDAHGHDVGDQLLRMVGAKLADVGGGGRAFRYGGEEFAVLFPGRSADEALPHLEALRARLAAAGFIVRGRRRPRAKPDTPRQSASRRKVIVTVSIGVAAADRERSTPDQVIRAADAALYRAKRAGRNRLCT